MTSDKLTVNELFSGIGSQRKALERLGIDHEVVGICEIDKYAIQSYEAIYGETKNYGDICTAPRLDYADLWTYSFPCQDISVAGKQQGISEHTRSGLLYQVQRLLEVAKDEGILPKYLLLENVKNLVGKKFKSQFEDWLFYLEQLGYDTYWQVLNAKNYGIPQNRERVFAVSIRKDLGETFEFSKAEPLTKKLADILEDEVEDKYYLSQDKVANLIHNFENSDYIAVKEATKKGYAKAAVGDSINIEQPNSKTRRGRVGHGVPQTLTTAPQQVVVESKKVINRVINPLKGKTPYGWHFEQAVYDSNGIARAVKAGGGSGNIPKVIQVGNYMNTTSFGGNPQCDRVYDSKGISPTLNTMQGGDRQPKIIKDTKIRKLTPLECWRLMGFDDTDFYKAKNSGVSNSQLYKQAGNSIVVNVLEGIFKQLLGGNYDTL